jgi:hypothetical protein
VQHLKGIELTSLVAKVLLMLLSFELLMLISIAV